MAKWTRKTVDSQIEKDLITGMIVNDQFLKGIVPILKVEMLQLPFARTVANWCIEYFTTYEKAPGKTIQDLFLHHSNRNLEETQAELISEFLSKLSEQYEEKKEFNVPYILDKVENYLKTRSLELLSQDIKSMTMAGNIQEAESLIAKFKRVERPKSTGVDLLTDKEAIINAFEGQEDSLFQLSGDLGEELGPLARGDFLAVFAPTSRGKTWWLQEIAIKALYAGLKVVFVSLEMTQPQLIVRGYQYLLGQGKKAKDVYIPIFDCMKNQTGLCKKGVRTNNIILRESIDEELPDYEEVSYDYKTCIECKGTTEYEHAAWFRKVKKQGISWKKAIKKGSVLSRNIRTGHFHLICFPSGSISIAGVKTYLDNLEYYKGFIPDVIITDYADIMAPVKGYKESRHQINDTWLFHRGLAQERHCLVVTASHTNKNTFEKRIKQSDPNEESRKLHHLTHAIALNQTDEEKKRGVIRVGFLKKREDFFSVSKDVMVLQALDIGKPYLDSYILK